MASNGATDTAQLTTAHSVNSPSVATITSEKYPTRFGSPPPATGPVTVNSATHSTHQNHTTKLPSSASTRIACSTISVPICLCSRPSTLRSTIVRPTAETTTHATTMIGANHSATLNTAGTNTCIAFAKVAAEPIGSS